MKNLAKTDNYCQQMVEKEDPDRYLVCLFAPSKVRRHLFALYAFNQELAKTRENVSEPTLGEIRLTWWREAIDGISEGNVRDHPVVRALAEIPDFQKIYALLEGIISARTLDIYSDGPVNMDALSEYVEKTGGDLSKAAAILEFGNDNKDILTSAHATGSAFAMVGLVRASVWQAASNIHFLPEDQKKTINPGSKDTLKEISPILDNMISKASTWLKEARTVSPKGRGSIFRLATSTERYISDFKTRSYHLASEKPLGAITPGHILNQIWRGLRGVS